MKIKKLIIHLRKSISIYVGIILIAFFFSCEKNESAFNISECDDEKDCYSDYVIESHTGDLQEGVDSMQLISANHPLLSQALNSDYFNKYKDNKYNELLQIFSIYYYDNNTAALIISNAQETSAFAYIVNSESFEFVEVLDAEFNPNYNSKSEAQLETKKPLLIISSLTSKKVLFDSSLKSGFSDCMKESMDLLYNDFSTFQSTIGTVACYASGPVCVLAAIIHCTVFKYETPIEPAINIPEIKNQNPDLIKINKDQPIKQKA